MKVLIFTVVALSAAVEALREMAPEELTAFDYHNRFGIVEAMRIMLEEEQAMQDPNRIVGGEASALGEDPHLGGLVITMTNGMTSVCGSSLLTNTRAVTAAHCWWDGKSQARQYEVVLGSTMLFSGGTRVNTTNVQTHGSWNPSGSFENDVAIIIIPFVSYTNSINRVLLPTGTEHYAGTWATAAGFGVNDDSATGVGEHQTKHHVNLQVITNAVCQQTLGSGIIASMLCTSGADGRSTCRGDSGGPLAVTSGADRILIGITSFGLEAGCQKGFPAAFTRVTSFATWINARL